MNMRTTKLEYALYPLQYKHYKIKRFLRMCREISMYGREIHVGCIPEKVNKPSRPLLTSNSYKKGILTVFRGIVTATLCSLTNYLFSICTSSEDFHNNTSKMSTYKKVVSR